MLKKQNVRELHLSYHNGEHYSSIRSQGDKTSMPTNIHFYEEKPNSNNNKAKFFTVSQLSDYENNISDELANLLLEDKNFSEKIELIIEITKCHDIDLIRKNLLENNFDIEFTINSILSNQLSSLEDLEYKPISSKNNKKFEKKQIQMERQRNKVIEQRKNELLPKLIKN